LRGTRDRVVTTPPDGTHCIVCSDRFVPGAPVLFDREGMLHVECHRRFAEPVVPAGVGRRAWYRKIVRHALGLRRHLQTSRRALRSQRERLVTSSGARIEQGQALAAAVFAIMERSGARRAALRPMGLAGELPDAGAGADLLWSPLDLRAMRERFARDRD